MLLRLCNLVFKVLHLSSELKYRKGKISRSQLLASLLLQDCNYLLLGGLGGSGDGGAGAGGLPAGKDFSLSKIQEE